MKSQKPNNQTCLVAGLICVIILSMNACSSDNYTKVRAEGKDFYWHFTYPGPDKKFDTADDVKSAQLLHLPNKKKTIIEVTSHDYIYMFRSEALNIKEVAVPGMTFSIEFTPSEVGKFELVVDPMCGFNFMHDNDYMGFIYLTSSQEFTQWISSKS